MSRDINSRSTPYADDVITSTDNDARMIASDAATRRHSDVIMLVFDVICSSLLMALKAARRRGDVVTSLIAVLLIGIQSGRSCHCMHHRVGRLYGVAVERIFVEFIRKKTSRRYKLKF